MGTRSVIAKPYGDIWQGRYCHWDGYPQNNAGAIWYMVKRDGLEVARKTLVDDNFYWSSLDPFADKVPYDGDSRFFLVPGYGIAGNEEQSSPDEWWTPENLGDSWIEWVYILADEGLMVLDGGQALMGFYPWVLEEPDWQLEVDKYSDYSDDEHDSIWTTVIGAKE